MISNLKVNELINLYRIKAKLCIEKIEKDEDVKFHSAAKTIYLGIIKNLEDLKKE